MNSNDNYSFLSSKQKNNISAKTRQKSSYLWLHPQNTDMIKVLLRRKPIALILVFHVLIGH